MFILSACIGVLSAMALTALVIGARLAPTKPPDFGGSLNALSIVAAILFGLITCCWGTWEVFGSLSGARMAVDYPVRFVLWLGAGLADSATGLALLALAGVAVAIMSAPTEKKEGLVRLRARVAPVLLLVAAAQVFSAIAYAVMNFI